MEEEDDDNLTYWDIIEMGVIYKTEEDEDESEEDEE